MLSMVGEYRTHKNRLNTDANSGRFEDGIYQASGSHRGLIEPKKLPNPVKESKHHREMHRELLFTHRKGLFPEHKPELQRVLETRRLKQLKQQEETHTPLRDLEEELRKRQQKLDQYERELAQNGGQDSRPEFILVKESLKKIKQSPETAIRVPKKFALTKVSLERHISGDYDEKDTEQRAEKRQLLTHTFFTSYCPFLQLLVLKRAAIEHDVLLGVLKMLKRGHRKEGFYRWRRYGTEARKNHRDSRTRYITDAHYWLEGHGQSRNHEPLPCILQGEA
ncbi:uncharacterized protein LOC143835868 isoform X2 [Paroedura picta]|uniref:uncharacterized protein LOC143835868 isoform X2 n=1 Tax=Paroedura picta TaxID=143630 RepID=UPI004057B243